MARANKTRENIEILNMNQFTPKKGSKSNLLAFFTVRVGDVCFKDCRLCTVKGDYVVNMPQEQGSDGKYYNRVWIDCGSGKEDNKDYYALITDEAVKYYESL